MVMSLRIHMQTADELRQNRYGRLRRMCYLWHWWEPTTKDASTVTCPRCIKLLAEQVSEALAEEVSKDIPFGLGLATATGKDLDRLAAIIGINLASAPNLDSEG